MLLSSINENMPKTIGVLGSGQLAKMLAQSAYRMGLNIAVIDKSEKTPAGDMTKLDYTKGWENREELNKFIDSSDIITLENEFIDINILEYVETKKKLFPSAATMRKVQDKFIQKQTFSSAGIKVADFEAINNKEDALKFAERYGYPYLIKTRTLGYDGYGNMTIKNEEDIEEAIKKFSGREIMAERFINFQKELAVMAVRNESGQTKTYPCVETIQQNHICHQVLAPAAIDSELAKSAQEIAIKCVESINGVGVFGIELFLTGDEEILVNEIAPRPHNSGHYTIEACYSSQYDNCLRAVLDLPLGDTSMLKPSAVMINLLGQHSEAGTPKDIKPMLNFERASLHLYNKKTSRKGRKMGHITVLGEDLKETQEYALNAANAIIW